jgi:hypothetical protein
VPRLNAGEPFLTKALERAGRKRQLADVGCALLVCAQPVQDFVAVFGEGLLPLGLAADGVAPPTTPGWIATTARRPLVYAGQRLECVTYTPGVLVFRQFATALEITRKADTKGDTTVSCEGVR